MDEDAGLEAIAAVDGLSWRAWVDAAGDDGQREDLDFGFCWAKAVVIVERVGWRMAGAWLACRIDAREV